MMMVLKRVDDDTPNSTLDALHSIYSQSFPVAEQRGWHDVCRLALDPASPYTLYAIEEDGCVAGLVSTWALPDALYVEHLAVDSHLRGSGIGGMVVDALVSNASPLPLLLEVEPQSEGEMACRRIGFYERHGLLAHHTFGYVQPSYGPGLPPVALTLMTSVADVDLSQLTEQLHRIVYGV